jgi:hypothetical protein
VVFEAREVADDDPHEETEWWWGGSVRSFLERRWEATGG